MTKSRTQKSVRNIVFGIGTQIFSLFLAFFSRTIFINILGNDYLSVNGLFTNILTLLSFAELGIGSAITYSLYKPLAEGNKEEIAAIVNTLKRIMNIVGIVVFSLGVCLIPFLDKLINNVPDIQESINLLFILFLLNASLSYVMSHSLTLFTADEKNYWVLVLKQSVATAQTILQMVVLLLTHNYILYLSLQICGTVLNNIVATVIMNKYYPFIRKYKNTKMSKNGINTLTKNVKALVVYKLGANILTGTDNIIISLIISTAMIGKASNYTLIITSIINLGMQITNSIMASIGNLNATETKENREKVFYELHFGSFWMFFVLCVCLSVMLTPFITWWIGNEFILDEKVVVALVLASFTMGMNQIPSLFRSSMGYYNEVKFVPFLASVLNIALSVILGKIFGLLGVYAATSISRILSYNLVDPLFVTQKGLHSRSGKFYLKTLAYYTIYLLSVVFFSKLIGIINIKGFFGLMIQAMITFLLANIVIIIAFWRSNEFKDFISRFQSMFVNKYRRVKGVNKR